MHSDLPPAHHFVLAQAPTPSASPLLEVSSNRTMGTHPMLVMGTPESALLWPLATFTPPDAQQMVISVRLVHPAWKARKPDFSSESHVLEATEPFDLAAVRDGKLKSLKVSISRAGADRPEWKGVEVQVKAVPWSSALHPRNATVPRLLYRVFGSAGDTFLVHELSGNPDFHHVLKVTFKDRRLSDEELARGVLVNVNDLPNVKGARLRLGDSPAGTALAEGDVPVKFKVVRELLFREVVAPEDFSASGSGGPEPVSR